MVGLLLGIGPVHLTHNLFLDDVLLVSTFPTSVILIQKLCSSLNCYKVCVSVSDCACVSISCCLHVKKASSNNVIMHASHSTAQQ